MLFSVYWSLKRFINWVFLKELRGSPMKNKKAISPVITTILLVLIAIILAVLILLWARGFIKEKVMKFDEPIERSCEKVNIQASLNSDGTISLVNNGDISLYRLDASILSGGSSTILHSQKKNIGPGYSGIVSYDSALSGEILLVPVLLGQAETSGEKQEYQCPSQYWKQLA